MQICLIILHTMSTPYFRTDVCADVCALHITLHCINLNTYQLKKAIFDIYFNRFLSCVAIWSVLRNIFQSAFPAVSGGQDTKPDALWSANITCFRCSTAKLCHTDVRCNCCSPLFHYGFEQSWDFLVELLLLCPLVCQCNQQTISYCILELLLLHLSLWLSVSLS